MTEKKLYYPTPREASQAHFYIFFLCKEMEKAPIYELYQFKPYIERLHKRFPGSAEFLELEPREMLRRHKMGIEAAKVLAVPVK